MADRVGPLGAIQSLLRQGDVGPTQALREYRAAGGQIRTQRWFRAWGEMAAELAARPAVQAAPLESYPEGGQLTRVQSARPGAYLYVGGVMVFDRPTNEPILKAASIRSSTLLTYAQAQNLLEQQVGMGADSYGYTVAGGYVTAVRELVPVEDNPADVSL